MNARAIHATIIYTPSSTDLFEMVCVYCFYWLLSRENLECIPFNLSRKMSNRPLQPYYLIHPDCIIVYLLNKVIRLNKYS